MRPVGRLLHLAQRNMLLLLLLTYVVGALLPRAGLSLRTVTLLRTPSVSLPAALLGWLLFVAALGARADELRRLVRRPAAALAGLGANLVWPLLFAVTLSLVLRAWHNPDELQNILVGLTLVGTMPVAGASTAWSQNSDGNLAMSLALVIGSTLLSPLTTPLGLRLMSLVTKGDYSEDLSELAASGAVSFVVIAAVVPTLVGLGLRAALGVRRVERLLPALKLANLAVLLTLNYANAAAALPQVIARPDWDFLALIVGITVALCVSAFLVGALLGRLFRTDRATQTSLMFGLGMSNNGGGLVLASEQLADHPLVLIPIIVYNLVQQVVAGIVDRRRRR